MAHRGDHLRQRRSVLNMDEVTLNSWNSIAPTTRTAGQGGTAVTRFWGKLPMLAAALVITIAYTYAADTPLLEPHNLIVDRSLPREQADTQIIAARRYDTDRKSTRLNSSHQIISYAVFCLKKKKQKHRTM